MALRILQQALEKNFRVEITPQDVGATGDLTDNAAGTFNMNGRILDHSNNFDLQVADLTPAHSFVGLPVPHQLDGMFTLQEIVQALPLIALGSEGTDRGNVLFKCAKLSYYHKIVIKLYDNTPAGAVLRETETQYMLMSQPRAVQGSRQGVIASANFQLVTVFDTTLPGGGAFMANPAYS